MKTSRILTLLAALLALTMSQGSALADYAFDFNAPVLELEVEIAIIGAFDNILHNTGSTDDIYTISMVKNAPDDWTATMCFGTTCYPPFITEIEVPLAAGMEDDLIIDLTPGSEGIGSVTITVRSQGSPALSETRTFNVNTPGAGGLDFDFIATDQGAVADILELVPFHTTLTNNSGADDIYTVSLVKNASDLWTGTICVGETCYPPFITEVEVPLGDGEMINVDIDLTPGDVDEGSLAITITSGNNPGQSDTKNFTVITPGLDVLLVAGDDEMGSDIWYRDALLAQGKTLGTWKRQEMGSLGIHEISAFDTVVWEAGTVEGGLNIEDFAALSYFIQHGGGLFLSGQNLAYESCDPGSPFYSVTSHGWFNSVLMTDFVSDELFADSAYGPGGDVVTENLAFNLFGGDGADNNDSLDALTPMGNAVATLLYDTGSTAATRATYGDGKVFFCGFAFEGIDTAANRNALMGQVLAWFAGQLTPAGDVIAPLMASVPYASPNPFNPQTSILFEVGGSRDVAGEVVIYNLRGQAVRNLFQGTVSPGPQNLVWNGRNDEGRNLATGVYFARVRLADQSKTVKMTLVK